MTTKDRSLPAPPGSWAPLLRLAERAGRPLDRFLHIEAASGLILLAAAALALFWINSPYGDSYRALWQTPLGVRVGELRFERSLEWFVNDVLMVIFFFVVGLEIKRELHHGELSEWRRAALPVIAALGGMLAPALIYLLVAGAPETRHGWGVPTATDIAFAVGILSLLGPRVPAALRVLLLALAVIDDLGAIVVIAIFYSSGVELAGLGVAALGLGAIFALQRFGVRAKLAYVPAGALVWGGIYAAGVHPTIAGVIIGFATPVSAWLGAEGFLRGIEEELTALRSGPGAPGGDELRLALRHVDDVRREARSPAESLIDKLHPWVAFGIMPLFALANAGVSLGGLALDAQTERVAFGAGLGLVLGKPIGILLACWGSIRLGLALAPVGLKGRQFLVLGLVAGVGFTMALFIAQLAFDDPRLLAAAKLGVLCGSATAAVVGLVVGRILLPRERPAGEALTADEAERSTTT